MDILDMLIKFHQCNELYKFQIFKEPLRRVNETYTETIGTMQRKKDAHVCNRNIHNFTRRLVTSLQAKYIFSVVGM